MTEKLEVSFNSPQCGWMSVGFSVGQKEFHTTTAHAPHENALTELLGILSELVDGVGALDKTLKWNRDPEEFDFVFHRTDGGKTLLEIIEYPTEDREERTGDKVFSYEGDTREICAAFYETFQQLFVEREADEFEENWRQPFPVREFENFGQKMGSD